MLSLFGREVYVRTRRRTSHEGFHATEAWRLERDLERGQETNRIVRVRGELDAERAPKAVEQAPCSIVVRMRLEPRVIDAGHGGVCLAKLGEVAARSRSDTARA